MHAEGQAPEADKMLLLAFARPFLGPAKLAALAKAGPLSFAPSPLLSAENAALLSRLADSFNAEAARRRMETEGIKIVFRGTPGFPARLGNTPEPPFAVFFRGALPGTGPNLAVVGSRRATAYGKIALNMLVPPLAREGFGIISGLAYGIDAEAHRAALRVGAYTAAVLGGGIDRATLYPFHHRQLADEIVGAGGAVVSEYPPLCKPRPYFFPQRNRVIAAFADAVLLPEASVKSGAMSTVGAALDQGKDVFAVPGPITSELSEGPNRLIRDGAIPALSAEDIAEHFRIQETLPAPRKNATTAPSAADGSPENDILGFLGRGPAALDELFKNINIPPSDINATLTIMEIEGRIRDIGGKIFMRIN